MQLMCLCVMLNMFVGIAAEGRNKRWIPQFSSTMENPGIQGLETLGMTKNMLETLEQLGIYARATTLVRYVQFSIHQ